MLSEAEKHYCKQILNLLAADDIFTLVRTSTNYAIKTDSRSEAENAILAFTESAEELLNRKKITKGVLLNYCLNARIPASASDTKADLVGTIIKNWTPTTLQKPSMTSASADQQQAHVSSVTEYHRNHNVSSNYQPPPVTIIQNYVNFGDITETHNKTYNFSNVPNLADTDQVNAEAFVKWFYQMLNSYHPAMNNPGESFGPQHFWDNAQLFLLMVSSSEKEEETIEGNDKIAERLLAFPKSRHILFNPNVNSQGVTLRSSCHGSKLILVCGTLHRADDCFGIFQQSFALVSSPLSPGMWKVKVSCLKMDHCPTSTLPRLEDCQEIPAIEAHTALALERSQVVGPS